MSGFQDDNFDNANPATRREGFGGQQRGGTDSYGNGAGAGATDPANTGLGGYGTSRVTGAGSGTGIGMDRNRQTVGRPGEDVNFTGSDSTYDKTDTGATFTGNTDQGDDWNKGSAYGAGAGAGGAGGQGLQSSQSQRASDFSRGGDQSDDPYQQGQQGQQDQQGQQGRQGGKPGLTDKMRGNAEKLAGSVTGNHDMKMRGQERMTGDNDF